MANGRALVPPPPFTYAPSGLLSVATDMTSQFDSHWGAGITWMPLCSTPGSTYDECVALDASGGTPAAPPTKGATFENVRRAATPFTVIARKDCSTPTFWDDLPDDIVEALQQGESWQVERSFWTGVAGATDDVVHPHLASDTEVLDDGDMLELETDEVSASPVDIVRGLGLLEEGLADCYQGQGVIHIPPALIPALAAWGQVHLMNGKWVTCNGNLVAAGRGYTGSSPGNTAPGATTRWMYATGAVFYARGPVVPFTRVEMLNRSVNTIEALAERTYVVGWDCCLLGVPIGIDLTICCP